MSLLLVLALSAAVLPGCPTSATDDDDDVSNDDDATTDDDDSSGDDDDSSGDDDDSSGDDDDDDSTPDLSQTVFVASPSVIGGVASRISEPDGTVFWEGSGNQLVGGLTCGEVPGSLLAVVRDVPATYTLIGFEPSGGITSFDTFFFIPVGGGVLTTHVQPEVVSCGGTTYLATPEVVGGQAPAPSRVVTSSGGTIWSAETGRSIGGLACDGATLVVTTVGGLAPNYELHTLDLNGTLLTEAAYFDSAGFDVNDLGIQPEVAACDGIIYLATPTKIDPGGTSVERADVPSTVRTESGIILWSGGADEDVGGLACADDGGIYVVVTGGDPLQYELLHLSADGAVLDATTTFDHNGLGSTLNARDGEVASCPGF